jgi:hypothetical protein
MNATVIILVLLLVRLIIPFGLLLWVGENVQRRRLVDFRRMAG